MKSLHSLIPVHSRLTTFFPAFALIGFADCSSHSFLDKRHDTRNVRNSDEFKGHSLSRDVFMNAEDIETQNGSFLQFLSNNLDVHDLHPRRKSFKSCAVVGRSPISLKSTNGQEIDRHDAIFRAGICAPSPELIADLGKKKGYCVSFLGNYDGGQQIILQSRLLENATLLESPEVRNYHLHHRQVLVPKTSFFAEVDHSLEAWGSLQDVNYWRQHSVMHELECLKHRSSCPQIVDLSSGFYAVALAQQLCLTTDVYGFDQNTDPDSPYEHIDQIGVPLDNGRLVLKDHPHPFAFERQILRAWHEHLLIRLVPEPNSL